MQISGSTLYDGRTIEPMEEEAAVMDGELDLMTSQANAGTRREHINKKNMYV